MATRHYLEFDDFTRDEYDYLFSRIRWIKARFKRYELYQPLRDRTLAMVFEKASTRTRVSFEAGMNQLGGVAIHLQTGETQLARGEPIEDVARVISRMVDVVMIRTFEQAKLVRFAEYSRVPVINGLTDEYHPCQVLCDLFTYLEHRGPIEGRTVCWIGDPNNVCRTWLQAAKIFGFRLNVSSPPGYALPASDVAGAGGRLAVHADPHQAARGADLVYTDVWTSMGFEAEATERRKAFEDWRVDRELIAQAKTDALFMHCLPAHRGEEVEAEVIDGPQSVVWDEAENRLHGQKALLEYLLLGRVDTPAD
jgi:ornithine carbamoyltransferase